ncbi:unnamed protein product, partial [Mesorhabditis spiculigera]
MMVETMEKGLIDLNGLTTMLGSPSVSTHPCSLCSKSFPNSKLLQQHQQTFHTDKAFVCEICGKAFRFRSNLAEHRSVHTALKPFVCRYCGKSSRLKGNLTKHILKHHKKEQNEQIGKNDIIIKKGKKSVKDPAAVDFLEKSMFVIGPTKGAPPQEVPVSLLPKAEPETPNCGKAFFVSFGFDQSSMDLTDSHDENGMDSPEDTSSVTDSILLKQEMDSDASPNSPQNHHSTIGGAAGLNALLASVSCTPPPREKTESPSVTASISPPASLPKYDGTQCHECGKHFRKGSQLKNHLLLFHGFPGLEKSANEMKPEPEGMSDPGSGSAKDSSIFSDVVHEPTVGEVAAMQNDIRTIKNAVSDIRHEMRTHKPEPSNTLETRVSRMEKQIEMALNSIYTLVQLQTGITSSITKFRESMESDMLDLKNCRCRQEEN